MKLSVMSKATTHVVGADGGSVYEIVIKFGNDSLAKPT